MKRAHRRVHFGMWTIIAPLILWLLVLAFGDLPPSPQNETLPDSADRGGSLMSHDYKMVQWTPFKKRFDVWMLSGIALYLVAFVALHLCDAARGQQLHADPGPDPGDPARSPS